jgi:hypothetical protein
MVITLKTASEALQELYRVHFPECRPVDQSTVGQRQTDQGTHSCKINREDWKLAIRVTDLSEMKWAINIFRPFK